MCVNQRNYLPMAEVCMLLFAKQLAEETLLLFFRLIGNRLAHQFGKHLSKFGFLAESNVTTHFLTIFKKDKTGDVGYTQIRRHRIVFIYVHLTNGNFAAELLCEFIYNRRNGLTRAAPNGTEIYNDRFWPESSRRTAGRSPASRIYR